MGFLNTAGLCELFPDLTPTAIYTQRSRGKAPGSLGVRVNSRLFFDEADIAQWFEGEKRRQGVEVSE